jgi:hypothetical protein
VGAAIAISEFCAGIFAYLLVVHRTKLVAGFMGEMQSELVGCLALLIGVLGLYGCAGASAGWITGILCALYTIYLFARRARFQHWKVLAQVNE